MDVSRSLARLTEGLSTARSGSVLSVEGVALRLSLAEAQLGERLKTRGGALLEVVAFDGTEAVALALTPLERLRSGDAVTRLPGEPLIPTGQSALGRVLDPLGRPLDPGPPLPLVWPVHRRAPCPLSRKPVSAPLALGLRAIDGLCTLGRGQRVALEAGPGAGKTTLLAQIAAAAQVDAVVLALIGERGREVGATLAELSPEARARTAVVVARADDPPQAWLAAAETATALAESLRDDGREVLLLLDSLTRVARAVRTVGVAAGEPTTRRGFPPSLSSALSGLLERATNGPVGTLTALYAVLVEGQADDDPVAEETRGLLDGHLVLDPALITQGRFPALVVERSLSRCMSSLVSPAHRAAAAQVRRWLALLTESQPLRTVGAHRPGTHPELDLALSRATALARFLSQPKDQFCDFEGTVEHLLALTQP